ncbi:MAG: hypothetical protein OHK0012_13070 [Synechococcales cyanobacterium]
MLKVAYDISVLGQGMINPKAKTGVYRVVESLLLELIKSSEVEITAIPFNRISTIYEIISSSLYLEHQNIKNQIYYDSCFISRLNLSPIYQLGIELQRQLIQAGLNKFPILYKPALLLQIFYILIGKLDIISTFDPGRFNIYHSPFFSLPDLKITQKLQRVLTVYDLLPILTPQNFTSNSRSRFESIINSINPYRDWIICISENTKQDFCHYTGMNPERVFVTHLAASPKFYSITDPSLITQTQSNYNIPPEPYLLSLCTLEPRKNLKFLLQSYAQLLEQEPALNLNLVLVGVSGWKNNDIFQTIHNHPLLKRHTIIAGYIPDQDLSAIYSGALAFVYPSLYEGFGLPLLEAMQCGTPVICSNTSSLPEVVGNAGIRLDPYDNDAWCQAILDYVNKEYLRIDFAHRGLIRSKLFSWERCAKQTIDVYKLAASSD